MPNAGGAHEPIVLAHEALFTIGPLKVEPPLRRLSRNGVETFIQPRVMQVLVALARAEGDVLTRDDLIQCCWSGAIVTDDALNRIVSQVRKLAEGIGSDCFAVETVARVGYRLMRGPARRDASAAPAGPPDAPALAPHTLMKSVSASQQRRGWVGWIAGMLLVAGLAIALWYLLQPRPMRLPTLALAPFTAGGPGIPADLSANLDADLRSALSANRVELTAGPADLQLRGGVRRQGSGLRFTIDVVRPRGGSTLITFTRDVAAGRPLDELALYLARFLGCGVGFSRYRGSLPDRAQALVLQYCVKEVAGGDGQTPGEELDRGRALTRGAPDFAIGWAMIAEALSVTPRSEGQTDALLEEGRAAGRRATELDPDQPFAYQALALVWPRNEPVERERLLRHAVALAERGDSTLFLSGFPQQVLGDGLLQSGRLHEAAAMYRRGIDQDHTSTWPWIRLATARFAEGRSIEMADVLERVLASATPDDLPQSWRAQLAIYRGRWAEAAALTRAPTPEEQAALTAAFAALESGDGAQKSRAATALASLRLNANREATQAAMLGLLGDVDGVFAVIERSRRSGGLYSAPFARPGHPLPLLFDPRFAAVRRDPRFAPFLQRTGFYAYWRATQSRPDECASGDPPGYCRLIR